MEPVVYGNFKNILIIYMKDLGELNIHLNSLYLYNQLIIVQIINMFTILITF